MRSINIDKFVYSYDITTGTFTVPTGGDGYYYFSTFFVVRLYEYARFDIKINGETLCTAYTDQEIPSDDGQAACSAAVFAMEGVSLNYS